MKPAVSRFPLLPKRKKDVREGNASLAKVSDTSVVKGEEPGETR